MGKIPAPKNEKKNEKTEGISMTCKNPTSVDLIIF